MMRKRVVYIVLATVILAVLSGCVTHFLISPKYSASCTMYVYSNTDRVSTDSSIGTSEIAASQQLVKTYICILESDRVLEKVIEELDLNTTAGALQDMISCSQIEETEIFSVTVTSTNAVLSANVANAIAQVVPEEIVRVVKAGGVEVIDYAKVPSHPSSPDLKRNVIIGAMLGFVISFAIFFIYEMFDTTITSEKDITRDFDIPMLGTIPRLIPSSEKEPPSAAAQNENAKGGKKQ